MPPSSPYDIWAHLSSLTSSRGALLTGAAEATGLGLPASLPPADLLGDLPAGTAIETLLFVEVQRSVPALPAVLSGLKFTTN